MPIFLSFWKSFVFWKGKLGREKLEGKTVACETGLPLIMSQDITKWAWEENTEMFDSCKQKVYTFIITEATVLFLTAIMWLLFT